MAKETFRIESGKISADSIRDPTIICGYQGTGLVGALVVNHLIEEMAFSEIGSSQLREVPPVIALRQGRMFKPMSVLYNKEKNLIVIFILAPTAGIEWEIADTVETVSKNLKAKETIITDGITINSKDPVYYLSNYCNSNDCENLNKKIKPVKNSVVGGVTSALLMKDMKVLCFLGNLMGEANNQEFLSPVKSAVNVLDVLNWYLKLRIDTSKLEKLGEQMEKELETD